MNEAQNDCVLQNVIEELQDEDQQANQSTIENLRIPLKANLKRVLGHGMQGGVSILRNQSKPGRACKNIISQGNLHIFSHNHRRHQRDSNSCRRGTKISKSSNLLSRRDSKVVLITENRYQAQTSLINWTIEKSRQEAMIMRPGLARGIMQNVRRNPRLSLEE